jgi:hypothetical protein
MWLAALGVVFVGLGLAIGWYGLRPLAVVPRLLRSEVQEPSTVSERSFVVCRGTATAGEEGPIAAPFSGHECLGFEFEVTERQPSFVGLPWFDSYQDDGVATTTFELDGEYGSLAVDPSPRRFSLDTEPTVTTVGPGETPSDRIQRFLDVRELPAVVRWLAAIPFFGHRRFVERRIDPGEDYLVAGNVDHREGTTTFTGDLAITGRSPWGVALGRLRTAAFPLVVAVVFVVTGSWALLA